MADENTNAAEAPSDGGKPKSKMKKLIVIGGLMLVEGIVIFAGVKFLGGSPTESEAQEMPAEVSNMEQLLEDIGRETELEIAKISAYNNRPGNQMVYNLTVSCRVNTDVKEKAESLLELRSMTIQDRIQKVIRNADPQFMTEPGLETIRRQIKFELDQILGTDALINEILIPEIVQARGRL
jgi:flagellar basal body-associated protein FliL